MDSSTPAPQRFPLGLTLHYDPQLGIPVLTGTGIMTREAVDEWAAAVRQVMDAVPSGQPMYLLLDHSAKGQGFSPYIRQVSDELKAYFISKAIPQAYVAIIFPDTVAFFLIKTFLNTFVASHSQQLSIKLFTKSDEARTWLQTQRSVSAS